MVSGLDPGVAYFWKARHTMRSIRSGIRWIPNDMHVSFTFYFPTLLGLTIPIDQNIFGRLENTSLLPFFDVFGCSSVATKSWRCIKWPSSMAVRMEPCLACFSGPQQTHTHTQICRVRAFSPCQDDQYTVLSVDGYQINYKRFGRYLHKISWTLLHETDMFQGPSVCQVCSGLTEA